MFSPSETVQQQLRCNFYGLLFRLGVAQRSSEPKTRIFHRTHHLQSEIDVVGTWAQCMHDGLLGNWAIVETAGCYVLQNAWPRWVPEQAKQLFCWKLTAKEGSTTAAVSKPRPWLCRSAAIAFCATLSFHFTTMGQALLWTGMGSCMEDRAAAMSLT